MPEYPCACGRVHVSPFLFCPHCGSELMRLTVHREHPDVLQCGPRYLQVVDAQQRPVRLRGARLTDQGLVLEAESGQRWQMPLMDLYARLLDAQEQRLVI